MATVQPFAGTRFNPEHVKLGGVLAPPYDVISDAQRDELYGRDLRNIVRIDYGERFPDDVDGVDDRYTRAASFLKSWLDLGVLVRDDAPSFYVVDHHFPHPGGGERRRRGVLATVPATAWERSDLRPHELTMSGPKADRLALMHATHAQTSPVFAMWSGAAGDIEEVLARDTSGHALLGGRIDGEFGSEKLLVWRLSDPAACGGDRRGPARRPALRGRRSPSLRDRRGLSRRSGVRRIRPRPLTRRSSAASSTSTAARRPGDHHPADPPAGASRPGDRVQPRRPLGAARRHLRDGACRRRVVRRSPVPPSCERRTTPSRWSLTTAPPCCAARGAPEWLAPRRARRHGPRDRGARPGRESRRT